MKKFPTFLTAAFRAARRIARNSMAIILRLVMAFRHHDIDEICRAWLRIVFESAWLLCWTLVIICFAAGFVKPHCFVTGIFLAVVSGICRSNADDLYNSWRA